jgi:membrane-associated phospholipid phosphatase
MQLELSGLAGRLAWALLFFLVAWTALWLYALKPFVLADGTIPSLATMLSVFAANILVCRLLQKRLSSDASWVADKLRIAMKRLVLFSEASIYMLLFGTMGALLTYLAVTMGGPLYDTTYDAIDRALGFDWMAIMHWFDGKPLMAEGLIRAYSSSASQIGVAIILFSLLDQRRYMLEMMLILAISIIPTTILSGIWPAVGSYEFYKPQNHIFLEVGTDVGIWHVKHYLELRAGTFGEFHLAGVAGLVTFPSYHAVMAIAVTYAVRGYRWLLYPALALNTIVMIGAIFVGGHYFIDLVGGAAIALAAILIVRRVMAAEDRLVAGIPAEAPAAAGEPATA